MTDSNAPKGDRFGDPSFEPCHDKWTVIDRFSHDGYQYRLSRRPISNEGTAPRLSARERQVLEHAVRGMTNKAIARTLGVAPSTVGVLLFRAGSKLNVGGRAELLDKYSAVVRKESEGGGPSSSGTRAAVRVDVEHGVRRFA